MNQNIDGIIVAIAHARALLHTLGVHADNSEIPKSSEAASEEQLATERDAMQVHPLDGKGVIAILPSGFIHFGILRDLGGSYELRNASNLRYWKQRAGGLPEFAKTGPLSGDKIDKIGTVYVDSVLFFYPTGKWL